MVLHVGHLDLRVELPVLPGSEIFREKFFYILRNVYFYRSLKFISDSCPSCIVNTINCCIT